MPAPTAPPKTSKELASAVYDDFKRQVVDAAKKRAVAQHVDYESFKNMVAVAHLRPLQAPNTVKHEPSAPAWAFNPDGSRPTAEADAAAAARLASSAEACTPPSTSGDFGREWRRSCPTPDAKYRYLQVCGPETLRAIFRVEVTSEALKGIIEVLEACWQGHAGVAEERQEGHGGEGALGQASFVVDVLDALAGAGRFGLAVKLMGPQASKVLASLFDQLSPALEAAEALQHCLPDGSSGGAQGGGVALDGAGAADGAAPAQASSASSSLVRRGRDGLAALRKAYGV